MVLFLRRIFMVYTLISFAFACQDYPDASWSHLPELSEGCKERSSKHFSSSKLIEAAFRQISVSRYGAIRWIIVLKVYDRALRHFF